jgi:hypothetical protein
VKVCPSAGLKNCGGVDWLKAGGFAAKVGEADG